MTATLAAVLVEQSLISWDTTPADVWPAWTNTMQLQYRDVTLVQLLAHQTGLPVDVTVIPSPERIEDTAPGTLIEKRLIWAEELLKLTPANAVGGLSIHQCRLPCRRSNAGDSDRHPVGNADERQRFWPARQCCPLVTVRPVQCRPDRSATRSSRGKRCARFRSGRARCR